MKNDIIWATVLPSTCRIRTSRSLIFYFLSKLFQIHPRPPRNIPKLLPIILPNLPQSLLSIDLQPRSHIHPTLPVRLIRNLATFPTLPDPIPSTPLTKIPIITFTRSAAPHGFKKLQHTFLAERKPAEAAFRCSLDMPEHDIQRWISIRRLRRGGGL